VIIYERKGENQLFEAILEYAFFTDYIYTVVGLDDDKFIVGCKDKNIYICSYDFNDGPLVILQGKRFFFFKSDHQQLIFWLFY
jgi:hypothetical protein